MSVCVCNCIVFLCNVFNRVTLEQDVMGSSLTKCAKGISMAFIKMLCGLQNVYKKLTRNLESYLHLN